ncbi:hypothetical protein [Gracilibacillus xinjiangensis]|uniref:Prenyltransferase n=1 Tax=Gracilibacillus xinjiangensis TaxID=1193282 RepID=A0ABV8WQN6_9BACI
MMISKKTFTKTSNWLKRNARPLEVARWEYVFEGKDRTNVLEVLRAYQNDDGGFGHGIEPDFWLPDSSPMASWFAGQILLEVEAANDDPMVIALMDYLVKSYNKEAGLWLSVLPENNSYPHAPWWHWQENAQENWKFNPSAELAAFLLNWSSKQSDPWQIGNDVLNNALKRLMEANKMDSHEIFNYQRLYRMLIRKEAVLTGRSTCTLDQIFNKLAALIESSVEKDIKSWATGYKPLPLDFVVNSEDPFCKMFGDLVEANLKFYIEQLTEDGVWRIPWEWGQYPEVFPIAKRYWEGILAIDRYTKLQLFDCLE